MFYNNTARDQDRIDFPFKYHFHKWKSGYRICIHKNKAFGLTTRSRICVIIRPISPVIDTKESNHIYYVIQNHPPPRNHTAGTAVRRLLSRPRLDLSLRGSQFFSKGRNFRYICYETVGDSVKTHSRNRIDHVGIFILLKFEISEIEKTVT